MMHDKCHTVMEIRMGDQHEESRHHFDSAVTVHEFSPEDGSIRWYIKVFFDDDRDVATFMSVHPGGD